MPYYTMGLHEQTRVIHRVPTSWTHHLIHGVAVPDIHVLLAFRLGQLTYIVPLQAYSVQLSPEGMLDKITTLFIIKNCLFGAIG